MVQKPNVIKRPPRRVFVTSVRRLSPRRSAKTSMRRAFNMELRAVNTGASSRGFSPREAGTNAGRHPGR